MERVRRNPAVVIGAAVGLLEAVWQLLAVVLAFEPELNAAGAALIAALGGAATRLLVTPASDPRDGEGRPLVAIEEIPE